MGKAKRINNTNHFLFKPTTIKNRKKKMKREGRQHGMVRLKTATTRTLNRFQFPPTTSSFTRVSTKPTNLSKITATKYDRSKYYAHPFSNTKAKDKGKGTQKIRHSDLTLNRRLISCKVVAGDKIGHNGFNYVGVSASDLLGRLSNYHDDEEYDVDDDDDDDDDDELVVGFVEEVKIDDVQNVGDVDDVEDDMGFCDVGFVVQQLEGVDEGDDGWCLVAEIGDD